MRDVIRALAVVVVLAALPSSAAALPGDDSYIEGYATATVERGFRRATPSLRVQNGIVYIDAADLAGADRSRIIGSLSRIRGVVRVEVVEAGATASAPPPAVAPGDTAPPKILSVLQTGTFPGGSLFNPLVADPRWPHFGASYQSYLNSAGLEDVGAVSFGETVTIFRDRLGSGWWETGIQAGVFAVFDLAAESKDLVNADYFVGIFGGYRYQDVSAMGRLFHQSSHLGDEFILRTKPERVNLSYEAVDLKLSWDLNDMFRIYGGGGYLFDQEPASLDPWSTQYGVEFRSRWPGPDARVRPIAAIDVQNRQENAWHSDVSVRAGLQFEGVLATRNFQLLLEYFHGHSPNGQFYREKVEYLGLGAHFHF